MRARHGSVLGLRRPHSRSTNHTTNAAEGSRAYLRYRVHILVLVDPFPSLGNANARRRVCSTSVVHMHDIRRSSASRRILCMWFIVSGAVADRANIRVDRDRSTDPTGRVIASYLRQCTGLASTAGSLFWQVFAMPLRRWIRSFVVVMIRQTAGCIENAFAGDPARRRSFYCDHHATFPPMCHLCSISLDHTVGLAAAARQSVDASQRIHARGSLVDVAAQAGILVRTQSRLYSPYGD